MPKELDIKCQLALTMVGCGWAKGLLADEEWWTAKDLSVKKFENMKESGKKGK